jgi:creatinine amidohydrolase
VRAADRLLVRLWLPLTFFIATTTFAADTPAPGTREMERINWMEFREWVPGKINTVLLPLGTI